ncbi:MAG TPA: VOC family protein [Thermoleophilaceae bacterium]
MSALSGLSPATRLGPVHLAVTDLERSSGFYGDAIGLGVQGRENGVVALGAGGEDLLVLHEEPAASRAAAGRAGLYHFALLHPSRLELARAAQRLALTRTPIQGASDHKFSEAIYLPDPDGNGIELYADRPREQWPEPLEALPPGGPLPLDLQSLLELARDGEPGGRADPGLVVGHIHLHVGGLEDALGFYRDVVGFEPMILTPSAAFVSAGGYHHHLGLNTWRGEGVAPASADAVGLRRWTVLLPDDGEVERVRARVDEAGLEHEDRNGGFVVRDPWGIPLLVAAEAS